ncbi:hypothetical protein [Zoogloea sp.]|uniref:hypothetical protein n=1 Tax=Zoogloea sp. TaxID=49181 RepID=UPI0035B1DC9C
MTPELLLHPEPAQLSSTADTSDVLAALRQLGASDHWSERSLHTLDQLLVTWTANTAARQDDAEGIAELQRLIEYARNRTANQSSLPPASRDRWSALNDVLESRRYAIEGRRPERILNRAHVRTVLSLIGTGLSQPVLAEKLQDRNVEISPGRLSQLLSLMEAHGLIDRKREGRENRLTLTPAGQAAAPAPAVKPLRSKLAA